MIMISRRFIHGGIRFYEDHNIADWTTTERAVIYRFTFQDEGLILFSVQRNASFTVAGDRSLSGWENQEVSGNIFTLRTLFPSSNMGQ